jgi:hypothetical protein
MKRTQLRCVTTVINKTGLERENKQNKMKKAAPCVCVRVSELERTYLDMYIPLQSAERRNLSTQSHFAQQLNRVRPLRGGERVRYARGKTERAIRDSRGHRCARLRATVLL